MTDAEKRQIVAAANTDALKREGLAIIDGQFRDAKRWFDNSRRQTVRAAGPQGNGKVWIHFGLDNPSATDGYDT